MTVKVIEEHGTVRCDNCGALLSYSTDDIRTWFTDGARTHLVASHMDYVEAGTRTHGVKCSRMVFNRYGVYTVCTGYGIIDRVKTEPRITNRTNFSKWR